MSIYRLGFLSYLALLFCAPIQSFAVADIILTPEIPGPYEQVTAEISGYVIDIDRAEVYWYQDEEIQKQGIGERSYDFYTRGVGEPTTINVVIVTDKGQRIDKRLIIEPIEVDILWETDSYTPPFYRGKALPSSKSKLNVIALPNTTNLDDTTFVYTWKEGFYNIAQNYSGYERNFYRLEAQLQPYRRSVSVEAVSADKTKRAKNQVFIKSLEPELIPYPVRPLSGVEYANALTNSVEISSDELAITIEPYFMDGEAVLTNQMKYLWQANGGVLKESQSEGSNSFIFGKPPSDDGSFLIEVSAINDMEWLQRSTVNFEIYF